MPIAGVTGLALALLFVVPGFLVGMTKRRLVVPEGRTPFEELWSALAVSTVLVVGIEVGYRLFAGHGYLVPMGTSMAILSSSTYWIRYLMLLWISILVGLLWALVFRLGWTDAVTMGLGFRNTGGPGPWDELFKKDNEGWLAIHLKDGTLLIGAKALASCHPASHEILLREVEVHLADGSRSRAARVFVVADELAYIEEDMEPLGPLVGTP